MWVFGIRNAKSLFVINHQVGELVVTPSQFLAFCCTLNQLYARKNSRLFAPKDFAIAKTPLEGLILDHTPHVATHHDHNHRNNEEHDEAG